MTDKLSLSKLGFGDIASGVGSGVELNFLSESPLAVTAIPGKLIVAGQAIHSFVSALSHASLKECLSDLVPGEDSKKGFSATSTCRISGSKTKVHVVGVTSEASRHTSPYRPDALNKSLTSIFADTIGEAVKESGSIMVIACVPSKAAIASTVFSIARSVPYFSRKTEKGKDLEIPSHVVPINVYFHIANGDSVDSEQLSHLATVGSSIRMSQCLTDTPPNELNPTTYLAFVTHAVHAFNKTHASEGTIHMKAFHGKELEAHGMGGVWNVGKGNTTNPPVMIVLTYVPKGSKTGDKPSVVLVGKGITYDTGGLALKQPVPMIGMKTDMTGSGSMFASFLALAKMGGLTDGSDLHCVLCIAENSVGPDSMRNDDIIRLYSGLTVEVHNTDAEGRLVLGDGVAYAAKHLNPKLVIDMATLTGAQGIATGTQHAAIQASFEEDELGLVAAAKASGDNAFPILFAPEYHKPLYKSEVADMKNIPSNRMDAGSSCAGGFIYEQITAAGYTGRWAHIDMASPAAYSNGRGTGYGVALICAYLRQDIL